MTKSALAISLSCFGEYQRCCTQPEQRRREPSFGGDGASGDCHPQLSGHLCGCANLECCAGPILGLPFWTPIGIFAGEPSAVPMVDGSTAAGETVTLK